MKHDDRAPFRTLRDLVLKDLHGEKSLLKWGNDPSFAYATLNLILDSEAYILDRRARDYLIDLSSSLATKDLLASIGNTRMPFSSIWIETIVDLEDGSGEGSMGALVSSEAEGIKILAIQAMHDLKPWQPIYGGAEVIFRPRQVLFNKTPVARLYDRFAAHEGTSADEILKEEADKAVRIGSVFALLCAALSRPKIMERDPARPLSKSDAKTAISAGRRPPRFAPSVIRLSRAGQAERDAHHPSDSSVRASRSAHWVRGHVFLARNGQLTWRKAHVRGSGDPTARIKYVTE